ncbi:MAG: transglutaminase-like domain-containing protein [Candidatus Omnitrophica bacterium]|nr:transglutaminase-like domain-containing protein [Candidatus Omnitrophota bacterium]
MLSRTIRVAAMFAALLTCQAMAMEAGSIPCGGLVISQETYASDGVLVARPSALDETILDFIRDNCIYSLRDYTTWLKNNTLYIKDSGLDQLTPPAEMLKLKRGDCEDYAFLNAAVLKVLGYEPRTLSVGPHRPNHAICAFRKDGRYYWLDNAILKETPAKDLRDFAKFLRTGYNYSYVGGIKMDLASRKVLFSGIIA